MASLQPRESCIMLPLVGFLGGYLFLLYTGTGGVLFCPCVWNRWSLVWYFPSPRLCYCSFFTTLVSKYTYTCLYLLTHIIVWLFPVPTLYFCTVLLRFAQRMKTTVMVPWMHHHANTAVMAEWRHSSVGEIWCCRSCTWSVVYFFQEQWKCSQIGGGGVVGRIVKQLSWIELPWRGGKKTRRLTLTPGKCRTEFSDVSIFRGSVNSAIPEQYVFVWRQHAALLSLFVLLFEVR